MAIPNAPSGLVATAASASQIYLNWVDNSADELNFEVERSPNGTTGWTLIDSPAANVTVYSDEGLTQNTEYFYRVRASNADGDSAYTSVASALTFLTQREPFTPRLYIHQPAVILAAQVNWPSAAYPLDFFDVDNITSGTVAAVEAGMTLLIGTVAGADNLGRQRIRLDGSGSRLYVGRSSRGTHDGELTVTNDAYVTVLDDRRVWAKIPYITTDGTIYKDSDLAVGTNTTTPPPVANCGPGFAATIDSVTEEINVLFNGQSSFATSDAATITGYLWDIEDGTLLTGALTDEFIQVSFPAGFRYVSLTVTDSNGKTHTAYCPVYARDPEADTSFDEFSIESHRITAAGQTMSVNIYAYMLRLTYPDGTLVMIWDREPNSTAGRDHMLFQGWIDDEPASMNAVRAGLLRGVTLNLVDVAGRLAQLPGFPQSVADDATRDSGEIAAITWSYMTTPNLDKYLHYLLQWHSTALDLADFIWTGTGDEYEFVLLGSDGESLWEQVDRRARAFVPDRVLTCDRQGNIAIYPDPMLQDEADRTATVQVAIDEDEWSDIRYTYQRSPRVHWLRASAVLAGSTEPIGTVFSIAPGDTPGQGVGELTQGEQLAISQAALNAATGHRYARANATQGTLSITLVQDDGAGTFVPWSEIEPAQMEWVTLTVSAETAAQRGLTFTTARGLPKELNIRYNTTRTGTTRTVELVWERETVGEVGKTVIKPDVPAVGDQPVFVPWTPPVYGDPLVYSGNINAYILWDGAHVMRTWDLQAASPTWELVDSGISGTIYDGQYVHVAEDTVGMWLMTSTAIWWCGDIMATTPAWSSVLAIATVQAADATPASGVVEFKCMAHYDAQPGYLIVATGPVTNTTSNADYPHAYFWHTSDYGQNWVQVDMNAFIWVDIGGNDNGYAFAGRRSMIIYGSAGTIWCQRRTIRVGVNGRTAVFKSTDLGATWSKEFEVLAPTGDSDGTAMLRPFPDATDPTYMTRASGNVSQFPILYISTDGWATATSLSASAPSGYDGMTGIWRPNKHTFDNTHILGWWLKASDSTYDLFESYDQGATWSLLYASGLTASPTIVSRHNTPNGWPPDVLQWVLVRANGALADPVVQLTLDNFATLQNREGNLSSLFATWTSGLGDGFALPKVGPNA